MISKTILRLALFIIYTPVILSAQPKVIVAAAADLKPALDSIVAVYKARNGVTDIEIIYGASGNLFEQISTDAPFDIFLSADMDYPNKLKEENFTISGVYRYATGQLALWSIKNDPSVEQMNTLLKPDMVKIAIANPSTAPYGSRAVESMKYYKVYDKVVNKLVYGENIAQTGQFVSSGAADIGIIALSMARSPAMKKAGGSYWVIPETSHDPLVQGCVLLKHAAGSGEAKNLFDFFASEKAKAIFGFFGYIQKG